MDDDQSSLSHKILILECEHRSLDQEIVELEANIFVDQLRVRRLKREKLGLKESIEKLKSEQIPDLDA